LQGDEHKTGDRANAEGNTAGIRRNIETRTVLSLQESKRIQDYLNNEHTSISRSEMDGFSSGEKTSVSVDTTLKAPNGKPSNLTPEQWKQVRTPAFS